MTRGRPGNARGFTLVELTVVLFIIGIGTALAVPMIDAGLNSREVRRAARQIAATMHYCRGEAIATGTPQQLVIDPTENSIRTTGGRWAVLTDRAAIDEIAGGVPVGDGVVEILFFPNGATSGAEVVVASRRDRYQNRLRVSVDPLIGNVRVEDLAG
jgi:general secretion pathway protein H